MNKQKHAFTLVELIVVITILAVLWTIAFISLSWYSKTSRDSVRITDVWSMKSSLELFFIDAGKYPIPDDEWIATYSWETLWSQWDFWEVVVSNLSRNMRKIPLDPLNETKYIYSVTWNRWEFQLLSLLEWTDISLNLFDETNAIWIAVIPKIDWNFNWLFAKTTNYLIPIPSIITAEDISSWLALNATNIASQVTHLWSNIPHKWNVITNTWALTWLVLKSISIPTKKSSDAFKASVMEVIKSAYLSETSLNTDWIYKYILSVRWENNLSSLLDTVVLDNAAEALVITQGTDIIDQSTCELANWIWVNSENDVYIWSSQWWWFCISPRFWDWQTNWTDLNDWEWWISFNWWWNNSNIFFQWWDPSSIKDSWNLLPTLGQTKVLDSEVSYNCKTLWTASSDYETNDTIVW